jgi:hypothetical protein
VLLDALPDELPVEDPPPLDEPLLGEPLPDEEPPPEDVLPPQAPPSPAHALRGGRAAMVIAAMVANRRHVPISQEWTRSDF